MCGGHDGQASRPRGRLRPATARTAPQTIIVLARRRRGRCLKIVLAKRRPGRPHHRLLHRRRHGRIHPAVLLHHHQAVSHRSRRPPTTASTIPKPTRSPRRSMAWTTLPRPSPAPTAALTAPSKPSPWTKERTSTPSHPLRPSRPLSSVAARTDGATVSSSPAMAHEPFPPRMHGGPPPKSPLPIDGAKNERQPSRRASDCSDRPVTQPRTRRCSRRLSASTSTSRGT